MTAVLRRASGRVWRCGRRKIAAELVEKLPKDYMSPETTEAREGYLHPNVIKGNVEKTIIEFIIRDFTTDGLNEKKDYLDKLCKELSEKHKPARVEVDFTESYRNMKYKIDKHPQVVDYAMEARNNFV